MAPSDDASARDVVEGWVEDVGWRVTRWHAPIPADPAAVAVRLQITWPDGDYSEVEALTTGSAGRDKPHFLATSRDDGGLAILAGRCPTGTARVTFSASPAMVLYPAAGELFKELLVIAAVPMTDHPLEATLHDDHGRPVTSLTIRL